MRAETRSAHEATDQAIDEVANVTTELGYAVFLNVMHQLTITVGPIVDHSSELAELGKRSAKLIECLELDLENTVTAPRFPTSHTEEQRPNRGASAAAGAGYVIEGSSMGAAVLRRRLLSESPTASTFYFDALLEGRMQRWTAFCQWLNTSQQTDVQRQAAAVAANETFSCALQSLSRCRSITIPT